MGRIAGWFRRQHRKQINQLLLKHLDATKDAVRELLRGIESLNSGRMEEGEQRLELCVRKEEEADYLRRMIVRELEKGELPPEEREDLMWLVARLDLVADWAKEATRILRIIPFEQLPEELRRNVCRTLTMVDKCVQALVLSVRRLFERPREALELTSRVEELEEEVDRLDLENRRLLVSMASCLPHGYVTVIDDFLHSIENIADAAEDTADVVQAIAIRRI